MKILRMAITAVCAGALVLALTACGGAANPAEPAAGGDVIPNASPVSDVPEPAWEPPEGEELRTAGNPIITSIFTADPSAHVWPTHPDRLFLYPSQDVFPSRGANRMDRYHVFSTTNMVDWVNHGEILRRADLEADENGYDQWGNRYWGNMKNDSYFMWAPDAAFSTTHPEGHGPYFFYFPISTGVDRTYIYSPDHPYVEEDYWQYHWQVGVAFSDSPYSGFRDNPVVPLLDHEGNRIIGNINMIDPSIYYRESTGEHYMVIGNGRLRVARMNPNMRQLAEPWVDLTDATYRYHEGPWMFSRVNDYGERVYYIMHAADNEAYTGENNLPANFAVQSYIWTTHSPNAPVEYWNPGSVILPPRAAAQTSHGSIVEFPKNSNNWYLFYHNAHLSMGATSLRSSAVDRVFFNPDGSINLVEPTPEGVPAIGPDADPAELDELFGEGNWSIEIPFFEFLEGDGEAFREGFVLHSTYPITGDNVEVYLANLGSQYVGNLHISDSYLEFQNVDGGAGGTALIEVDHATLTGGIAQLHVNGRLYALRVESTGAWGNFPNSAFVQVELEAGAVNAIRLGGMGINIRSISIHFPG